MSGATVVDQLIVKLGLDPKEFDKGQKQAAAAMIRTEQSVKKSSEGMTRSIVGFTGKLLGVATAAMAVKKAVSYVSDLSTEVRQLGIDSRNFGIAANELRNFQNLSEMFGGKAEDATRTVGNLTKAVYDLAYNGVVSDSLVMLGRLGVQFQDTAGNARDFNSIVLDTEKRVQGLMKGGKLTQQNANQMLLQAGFDPGLAQAIIAGKVTPSMQQQQARRQVTGEVVDAATAWEKSATNRDQAIAAATLRVLPNAAKAGTYANDKIAQGAEGASDATLSGTLDSIGDTLSGAAEHIKEGAKDLVQSLEEYGRQQQSELFPKGRQAYEGSIQRAAKKYGVDPEMLAGVLSTESNFDPSAKSSAGAVGIAQLMPKYFPGAGHDPEEDIDTAAAYLKALHGNFKQKGYSEDDAYYYALQSYNAGQSRVQKSMNGGAPLSQETLNYPGKVLGYAQGAVPTPNAGSSGGGGSVSNSVTIGKVDLHTQATDADGIARDFAGATRRKLTAAQSDGGMQ